ncbi:MAG: putative two-component sensor histidine kinase [Anaerolineaceae bacterium]|nr:MAG: putative two-component sensor histidine kinase [Anaerolineaceae bacterium]
MNVSEILVEIRPAWIRRVANSLARGAGVRENFQEQLERFYDLLVQAVQTGDPAWVDSVLYDWSSAPTQSDLREGQKNISAVLNRMVMMTYELAREDLTEQEALELLGTLLPIFTYALDKAAHYETETRVAFVSNELADMQGKLERLDRSKSSFISVAAHELKTPLTLIEGYTAMMRDIAKSDQSSQMDTLIDGVNNGIRRLRAIVDDMIDVSLIDNNLLSLNFQPVWLNHIFQLLRTEMIGSTAHRKQTFDLRPFPGSDQMLFADGERLYQAFRNILSNAIKYTPDGGKIIVDGRLLPGFIEVTIEDTGIGISTQDQEVIFAKFGQLGNASLHSSGKTKFKGGGPGLGLPISRGIVEAHGGAIWAESEGHDETQCPGSIFHVLLPLRTEPPDPKLARLFGVTKEKEATTE